MRFAVGDAQSGMAYHAHRTTDAVRAGRSTPGAHHITDAVRAGRFAPGAHHILRLTRGPRGQVARGIMWV